MKKTRAQYERYLNDFGVPESEKYNNGGRIRGKRYGSWLRRIDSILFDVMYNEHLRQLNKLPPTLLYGRGRSKEGVR
ncbi:hypothetical protein SAMN05446037_1006145 [Anaerovirgula multivorans]|uniref:Uncharacterized protein n=1 Tax=Anaerovirgula multivorans TaxID=312168 RepID=A0A239CT67_9FIRM|nr:hypothetical protein [Anaerovirgula multivorans]SNS23446.1 hypothetical protein SAMN05446037_1006145 [Anaerovirgula multivorans]